MKRLLAISILSLISQLSVNAEELNFPELLSSALNRSYQVQLSRIDSQISEKGVKEARAGYYPTLNGFATTERYNDLTHGNAQITAVGNEILLNRSYYQDMAAIGLSYNVFDFGVRRKQLDIAKADNKQKAILLEKSGRDLKLEVVDIYGDLLNFYKQSRIKSDKLSLYYDLIEIMKELRKAGEVSELDIVEQEIESSETKTLLDEINNNLSKKLTEVSYYTNTSYDISDLELKDFPETVSEVTSSDDGVIRLSARIEHLIPEKSPEVEACDLEIIKKQKEYEIQKKVNFPKLRFDTRYNFYGSDPSNFLSGIGDVGQRSFTIRLSTSFVLFDGFKNINTISKKKLEISKAKIERERQIAEVKKKYEQIQLDNMNAILQAENNTRTLELVNKNLAMLERLNTTGLIEKSECIKKRLELLDKKEKLEQEKIKNFVAQYKLYVLSSNEVDI